jgi:hypothetical protein
MTPWLIHIGYRKCGSTWMQKRLFPAIPGVDFLGKRYGQPGTDWLKEVRGGLMYKHCFDFSPKAIREVIDQHAGPSDGRPRVLSYEGLSGEMWRRSHDSKRSADRIHQTFPEAKILIVVRRQPGHLESLYKQYLLTGGVLSIAKFLTADEHHLQFDIDCLQYDRLVGYYIQLFGRKNVEVLPFELLAADTQAFSNAVCDAAGVSHINLTAGDRDYVRRGYSARECALVRRINVLRKSTFIPTGFYQKPNNTTKSRLGILNPYPLANSLAAIADRVFGPGKLLSVEQKAQLTEHFRESNKALASLFPILAYYGYVAAPCANSASVPGNS